MKKMTSLCLIGMTISMVMYGYPQKVHQHIVTQAEALLELKYPHINFSVFNSYIGDEEPYGNYSWSGNEPICSENWRDPWINAGVWREDCSNPYFTEWNNLADLFNTHFWNSNAGDDSYGLPVGSENCINAYQKALSYIEGGIEFDLWYGDNNEGYLFILPIVNSENNLTINDCHGLRVEIITDLPTFHKDGVLKVYGYYGHYTGSYCPTSTYYIEYSTPKYVVIPSDGSLDGGLDREYITMQLLGRIAHLLMDVSVPAHAHLDDHICQVDADYYEQWTGAETGTTPNEWDCENSCTNYYARQFTAQTALASGGIVDMRYINNPIRYLFYLTDQIALHYPCGNPNGEIDVSGVSGIYGGDNNGNEIYDGDDYSILETIPGILDTPPSAVNPQSQGNVLLNWAIRATASLFYWFMVESEMIDEVKCENFAYLTTVDSKFKIMDQSSGETIADDIDHEEKTTLRHAYDYTVKTKKWDPGYNNLWHYCWNNDQQEFLLKHDFTSAPNQVQRAIFAPRISVTINSASGYSKIQDPWCVDDENEVRFYPPIYINVMSGNSYKVFLDQNKYFEPDKPIYRLKAPKAYATTSAIYVFDYWKSMSAEEAVFNEEGDTETTDRVTEVVFKSEGATVEAKYTQVNQIANYNLNIPSDETFTIPANAKIELANFFNINVQGELSVEGTAENPVTLWSSTIWRGIDVFPGSNLTLDHCNLKDAYSVVNIDEDEGLIIFNMNNCVITDCYYGIYYYGNYEDVIPTVIACIDNCTFIEGNGIFTFEPDDYNYPTNIVFRDNIFYQSSIVSQLGSNYYVNDFYSCEFIEPDEIYFHNHDNIFEDPLFTDDYHLQPGSPCIDAGTPNEYDPDGTVTDIGAYYYPQTTFSGTIDSDTTWYGTITITGDVTVASGAKLEIEPYTTVKFDDVKKMTIYGILQADGGDSSTITFTSSDSTPVKGQWSKIKFHNYSVDDSCYIKNCIIEYADLGVSCYYANPTIQYNTISNCNCGISMSYSSPTIESNYITDNTNGIYGVLSSPMINNNFIKGNSSKGTYFFLNSYPNYYDNTFDSNYYGAYFYWYCIPEFGPTTGSIKGKNVIKNGTYGIYAYNGDDPFLGSSTGYNTRVGGYNEIYSNSSYNAYAKYSSDIEAQWCWWGDSPPAGSKFYTYSGSSINYNNWLTSAPAGGGSSLAKSTTDLVQTTGNVNLTYLEAGFNPKKPNPNKLSDLWLWGHDLTINDKYEDAIEVYQRLISKFSNDDLAKKALAKLYVLNQKTGKGNFIGYLDHLLSNSKIRDNIRPAVYSLMMVCYAKENDIESAIKIGDTILEKYPDTEEEKVTLFSFVLFAVNDLNDAEMASNYLNVLKKKYPKDEVTLMAREAMGEKINWALMKPPIDAEPVEIVLPEKYALQNNYPNPFNPMTTIRYDLPQESRVTLVIYDIIGREVANLVNTKKPAGFHRVIWDAKDKHGNPVSSGVYIYRIQAVSSADGETGRFAQSRKMVYIR